MSREGIVARWCALCFSARHSLRRTLLFLRERGARALEERLSGKTSAATKAKEPDVEAGAVA